MRRIVAVVLVLSLHAVPARAVLIFDTMPDPGQPFGPRYPVWSLFEWQDVAIPFHVPANGHISRIETALSFQFTISPLLFGIAASTLQGATFPPVIHAWTVCGPSDPNFIAGCAGRPGRGADFVLSRGEFLAFDTNVALARGNYWLFVYFTTGDFHFGSWLSNNQLASDDWAIRGCEVGLAQGVGCTQAARWTEVSEFGPVLTEGAAVARGGEYPLPAGRIFFVPEQVPEPATLALVLAAVALSVLTTRSQSQVRRSAAHDVDRSSFTTSRTSFDQRSPRYSFL
jgi:hypothetical protein